MYFTYCQVLFTYVRKLGTTSSTMEFHPDNALGSGDGRFAGARRLFSVMLCLLKKLVDDVQSDSCLWKRTKVLSISILEMKL